MKLKTQTPPTEAQKAAKSAAEAFFSDLLQPKAKVTPKVKADKIWRESTTRRIVEHKGWTPVLRLYTVTHQHCDTCNADHAYAGEGLVQFSHSKRKDNLTLAVHSAAQYSPNSPIAKGCALDLPRQVRHEYEHTHWCATCLKLADIVDDVIERLNTPKQLELFN